MALVAVAAAVAVAAFPAMLIAAVPGLRFAGFKVVKPLPLPVKLVALTVPFTVWFPLNVLLPFVRATPDSWIVWLSIPELELKAGVSGVYCAVTVAVPIPTASAGTVSCAMPQVMVAEPTVIDGFEKLIVPVGVKIEDGVTVAVKVSGSPAVAGFADEITAVVVLDGVPENGPSSKTSPAKGSPDVSDVVP